jgi:hypothetical protein
LGRPQLEAGAVGLLVYEIVPEWRHETKQGGGAISHYFVKLPGFSLAGEYRIF